MSRFMHKLLFSLSGSAIIWRKQQPSINDACSSLIVATQFAIEEWGGVVRGSHWEPFVGGIFWFRSSEVWSSAKRTTVSIAQIVYRLCCSMRQRCSLKIFKKLARNLQVGGYRLQIETFDTSERKFGFNLKTFIEKPLARKPSVKFNKIRLIPVIGCTGITMCCQVDATITLLSLNQLLILIFYIFLSVLIVTLRNRFVSALHTTLWVLHSWFRTFGLRVLATTSLFMVPCSSLLVPCSFL